MCFLFLFNFIKTPKMKKIFSRLRLLLLLPFFFAVAYALPVITEVTPIPSPTTDSTPDYTFFSTETGTISYPNSACSSSTTVAQVGNNTITFNPLNHGTYGTCQIIVQDISGNPSNTLTVSQFNVNLRHPVITTIDIQSNNTNSAYAQFGNIITIVFTTNEPVQIPTVQILGRAATVSGSGTNWTAVTTAQGGDTDGIVPFSIRAVDFDGYATGTIITSTNGSSVTVDNTAPVITVANIRSNNPYDTSLASGTFLINGNISNALYLSFTTDEIVQTPRVTFPHNRASLATTTAPGYVAVTSGDNWVSRASIWDTDPDEVVYFEISFTDLAGNVGTIVTTTTDGSTVTVDNTPPTFPLVTIASNNPTDPSRAKVGETINVSFTSSEPLLSTSVDGDIFNRSAVVSGTGINWSFNTAGTSTDPEGLVAFSGIASDLAGNTASFNTSTNGSSVVFDRTDPVLSGFLTTIYSNNSNTSLLPMGFAKVGNDVTLEFETNEPVLVPVGTILGQAVIPTSPDQMHWTVKYSPTNTDVEGIIPFSYDIYDLAGNNTLTVSMTQDGSSVNFDRTVPNLNNMVTVDLMGAETSTFKHRSNASFSWMGQQDVQADGVTSGSGIRWYSGKLSNTEYPQQSFSSNPANSWTPNPLEPSDFPYELSISAEDQAGNISSITPAYSQLYSVGIEGTVVDSKGNPIENALVQVIARYGEECDTGKEVCVGTTNALGQYSIVVKKDQEYSITFFHKRYYLEKHDTKVGNYDIDVNSTLNGLTSVHESQTTNQGVEITTSEKFVGDDGLFTATSIFVYSFSGEITHTFINGEIVITSLGRITLIKSNNPSVTIVNNGDNTYNILNAGKVLNTRGITEATVSNSNTKSSACGTSSAYSSGNSRIGTKYIASNGSFGNTFGKYKTPSEWKSFGKRLKVGVAPQIITYINRNGYEIFAGYRKGIIGWDRFTKRFQNQVKYRGISRRNSFALTIENAPEKLQEVVTLSSRINIMKGSFQLSGDTKEDKKEALLQELANFKPLKRIRQKDAYKGIILRNAQKSKVNKFERKSPFAKRIVRDPYVQEIKIIKMQFANGASARIEKVIK